MNKCLSIALCAFFCWFFAPTALRAQQGIEIILSTPFPFQYNLEDLTFFTVHNTSGHSLDAYARATIFRIEDKRFIAEVTTRAFILNPEMNLFFGANAPQIRDQYIAPGFDHIRNTGQVPPGTYDICVTLYDSKTDLQIGATTCINNFQVEAPRIILQSPANHSAVTGPFINFMFEELSGQPAGISFGLKIVEKRHNQTGPDAIPGIAHFEIRNLTLRILQYPLEALELRPGVTYYWQVTAYAGDIPVAESEIWEFTVGGGDLQIISGYVFNDLNGNGLWEKSTDSGKEQGIHRVEILLHGPEQQNTFTDANGLFQFIVHTPGEYFVSVIVPADWKSTTPKSATIAPVLSQEVAIPEILFGNQWIPTVVSSVQDDSTKVQKCNCAIYELPINLKPVTGEAGCRFELYSVPDWTCGYGCFKDKLEYKWNVSSQDKNIAIATFADGNTVSNLVMPKLILHPISKGRSRLQLDLESTLKCKSASNYSDVNDCSKNAQRNLAIQINLSKTPCGEVVIKDIINDGANERGAQNRDDKEYFIIYEFEIIFKPEPKCDPKAIKNIVYNWNTKITHPFRAKVIDNNQKRVKVEVSINKKEIDDRKANPPILNAKLDIICSVVLTCSPGENTTNCSTEWNKINEESIETIVMNGFLQSTCGDAKEKTYNLTLAKPMEIGIGVPSARVRIDQTRPKNLPNLIVSIDIPKEGSNLTIGTTTNIVTTITNIGTKEAARNIIVKLLYDGIEIESKLVIETLARGSSATWVYSWDLPKDLKSNFYSLEAVVDPDSKIDEFDEGDNTSAVKINIVK